MGINNLPVPSFTNMCLNSLLFLQLWTVLQGYNKLWTFAFLSGPNVHVKLDLAVMFGRYDASLAIVLVTLFQFLPLFGCQQLVHIAANLVFDEACAECLSIGCLCRFRVHIDIQSYIDQS